MDKKTIEHLRQTDLGATECDTQRRLILLALIEDAARSDGAIARMLGCSTALVAHTRATWAAHQRVTDVLKRIKRLAPDEQQWLYTELGRLLQMTTP